jgi:hypothetical protein
MSKNIKYSGIAVLAAVLLGAAGGYIMYNQPHQDLADADVAYQLTATELFTQYEADEPAANARYLDQLIELTGTVAEKKPLEEGGGVLLLEAEGAMFGVNCAFQPSESASLAGIKPGQTVRLRGLCSGMLMDVSLSRCILVEAK